MKDFKFETEKKKKIEIRSNLNCRFPSKTN